MRRLIVAAVALSATAVLGTVGVTMVMSSSLAESGGGTGEGTDCQGVLRGEGAEPLRKTLISQAYDATADEYTLTYQLDTTRPDGTYRVRDCAWESESGTDYSGEPLLDEYDDKDATVAGGSSTFSIVVQGEDGDRICDQAALSNTDTDKSNVVCTELDSASPPAPEVPEVPSVLLVPVAGAAAFGAIWFLRRRSRASVS